MVDALADARVKFTWTVSVFSTQLMRSTSMDPRGDQAQSALSRRENGTNIALVAPVACKSEVRSMCGFFFGVALSSCQCSCNWLALSILVSFMCPEDGKTWARAHFLIKSATAVDRSR